MRCHRGSARRQGRLARLLVPAQLSCLVLAGCAAGPPATVQTFRAPPVGWSEAGGGAASPAVEDGHLELTGTRALVDRVAFRDVAASVDVALVGGEPRGFAGLFLADLQDRARGYHAIVVQTTGEARVYRSREPTEPLGGSGWRPAALDAATGFHRLGIRVAGDEVVLSIDGQTAGRTSLERPAAEARSAGRFRLGVLTRGTSARFKSFIGLTPGASTARLEDLADWGDAPLAQACLLAARREARAYTSRPTSGGLYRLLASLEEAARAARAAGDEPGLRSVRTVGERLAGDTLAPAENTGARDVHSRGFARLAALQGGGAPGKAGERQREQDPRLAALRDLPPLRLGFEVRGASPGSIVQKGDFWDAVREPYGGLERAAAGELSIRVEILRSENEEETTSSTRKVAAGATGGKTDALETELRALESRFAEDRLDAETRANVLRAAGKSLGAEVLAQLQPFSIDGRTYELQTDDGAALLAAAKRIASLRTEVERQRQGESQRWETVPATLHTSSILVELSYAVELDRRPVAGAERERTYLGIEQWTHPARRALGVGASRYEKGTVDAAVKAVRERALRRFRTAVAPQALLAGLPREQRLPFLVRLARATGSEDDLMSLQWALRNELGLEGDELERTASDLVRGGSPGT